MLKCAVALAILALGGCTSSPETKTELTIRNRTAELLEIRVGSGLFGSTVRIPPGGSWSGWVDRRWIQNSAWVDVRPAGDLSR